MVDRVAIQAGWGLGRQLFGQGGGGVRERRVSAGLGDSWPWSGGVQGLGVMRRAGVGRTWVQARDAEPVRLHL